MPSSALAEYEQTMEYSPVLLTVYVPVLHVYTACIFTLLCPEKKCLRQESRLSLRH